MISLLSKVTNHPPSPPIHPHAHFHPSFEMFFFSLLDVRPRTLARDVSRGAHTYPTQIQASLSNASAQCKCQQQRSHDDNNMILAGIACRAVMLPVPLFHYSIRPFVRSVIEFPITLRFSVSAPDIVFGSASVLLCCAVLLLYCCSNAARYVTSFPFAERPNGKKVKRKKRKSMLVERVGKSDLHPQQKNPRKLQIVNLIISRIPPFWTFS